MKAITLTQPWATLVAIGAKTYETRSWDTLYTGPLAIHAAKGFPVDARMLCLPQLIGGVFNPFFRPLFNAGFKTSDDLARGAIVAVCRLVCCAPTHTALVRDVWAPEGSNERAFGDYSPGRYAWNLCDVRALPEPIPCRGALGLWNVPAEIADQLRMMR